MKPSSLLLFCYFIGSSLFAVAQVEVKILPPQFITPCGPEYTYTLQLKSSDNQTYSKVEITYFLPQGMQYLAPSVSGMGIDEKDISNLNEPTFSIDKINNLPLNITFQVVADCELSNESRTVQDKLQLKYESQTINYSSPIYNINPIVLQVVDVKNSNVVANIGETFTRSFTIRNGGFAPISTLYIEDIHDPNSIVIEDIRPGEKQGDKIVVSAADFISVGNNDGVLDGGEQITIEETVRILDCGNSSSTIIFSWGCRGEVCQAFDTIQANIGQDLNSPYLRASIQVEQYAGFCTPGFLDIVVVNTANEITPGAAAAFDLILEMGMSGYFYQPAADSCLLLTNFMLNGNAVEIDLENFTDYGLNFNQFNFDPDGPGGIDDIDGDGIFDDLAAGDSIKLRFDIIFDEACTLSGCNNEFESTQFRIKANYRSQCQPQAADQTVGGVNHAYSFDFSSSVQKLTLEQPEASTFDLSLRFFGNLAGFEKSCDKDSAIVHMEIPIVLKIPQDFQPKFNGQDVAYDLNGATLSLYTGKYEGLLEMTFDAGCDSIPVEDEMLPCGGIIDNPSSLHRIRYWLEYFCDSDNCVEPINVLCDSTSNFLLSCPIPPSEVGILDQEMQVKRVSLGWTNSDLTTKVDPLDPNLKLQHAMTFDTILFEVVGTVTGAGNFDTTSVRISYYGDEELDYLAFQTDTLFFYDSETNQWITCPGVTPVITFDPENSEKQYVFTFLNLLESGNCLESIHLTDGDKMRFKAYYEVTRDAPKEPIVIPNLRGKFVFNHKGNFYECGGHYRDLKIFNPTYTQRFTSNYSGQACDTVEVIFSLYQGTSSIGIPDFFPFEFRPLARWNALKLTFPDWVSYIPGSAYFSYQYRPGNTESEEILIKSLATTDPKEDRNDQSLFLDFSEGVVFPTVDYITQATELSFGFKILPSCLSTSNIYLKQDAYLTENLYAEAQRAPVANQNTSQSAQYGAGSGFLQANNPIFYGINDTASWTFELCRRYGQSNYIPNNWIYIDLPSTAIKIISLQEMIGGGKTTSYPPVITTNGEDYWVKIDTSLRNQCRLFELRAVFTACEDISFKVLSNFDCSAYPDDPENHFSACGVSPLEMELALNPRQAALQINLVSTPTLPVSLCEPLTFAYKVINAGVGGAFDLEVSMELPEQGIFLVPGSSRLKAGLEEYIPISDPKFDPGSNMLVWQLSQIDALAGINQVPANEFWIEFQLDTECSYLPESVFSYQVSWVDVCRDAHSTSSFFALPLSLIGAPAASNQYGLGLTSEGFFVCRTQNDLRISITNHGGSIDGLTSPGERIRLSLPTELVSISGSLRGLHNFLDGQESNIYSEEEWEIIEWDLPPDIPPGDSIVFQISLQHSDMLATSCSTLPILLEIYESAGIPCKAIPGGLCDINFISTASSFEIQIQELPIRMNIEQLFAEVQQIDQERYTLQAVLEYEASGPATGAIQVDFYYDNNGDGQLQKELDISIDSRSRTFSFAPGKETQQIEEQISIPVDSTCLGILVYMDPIENACLCQPQVFYFSEVPLYNAGQTDTICLGDSTLLGRTAQNGYTYEWSPVSSLLAPDSAQSIYSFSRPLNADYLHRDQLVLKTTRSNGCQSSDTVTITTTGVDLNLKITQPISCHNDSDGIITAGIKGGLPPLEWQWQDSNSSELERIELSPGLYQLTLTNAIGCRMTDSVRLINPPSLGLHLETTDLDCHQRPDGKIKAQVSGGTPPYHYSWSNQKTTAEIAGLPAGTFNLTATDAHGCQIQGMETLTEPPALSLDIKVTDVTCRGDDNGIIEIIGVEQDSLLFSLTAANYQYTPRFEDLAPGTHTLHVVDSLFCYTTFRVVLPFPPFPLVKAPPDKVIDPGQSVDLPALIHESVSDFHWEADTTLSCLKCLSPTAGPLIADRRYTIHVSNQDGCEDSDEVRLSVRQTGLVFAPNVFSPNGDGINDRFTLYTAMIDAEILDLLIFDRWGTKLFENHHFPSNDGFLGWDGNFLGRPMPQGVYVYETRIKFQNGNILLKKGDVAIIR